MRKHLAIPLIASMLALALPRPVAAQENEPVQQVEPQQAQPMQVVIVEPELPDWKNRISFGPLGLLFGVGNFTYEREIKDWVSFEVSPWFIYFGFSDDSVYGFGLGLGPAFYITGNAPRGLRFSFNIAPGFIGADVTDVDGNSESETAFLFGAKALFGYNWAWQSGFSLGLAGGIQYMHFSLDNADTALNGVLPALEFNIGFVF